MDLTPRLLEQFVVLAEERHFGRAAERLSMSQPPLSQALQRLERQLGVPLLVRSTRAVRLTPAGEAFAQDARRLLDAQASAVERARRIAHGAEGELQLGYVSGLAHAFLPRLLREARQHLPGLRLHLHQNLSSELVASVRSGFLDLAFVRGPVADADGVDLQDLGSERLVVALPEEHSLAGRDILRLDDLVDEDFALPSLTALAALAEQVSAACRAVGFTPRELARADSLSGLLAGVAAGGAVALVPEQVGASRPAGVVFRPLEDPTGFLAVATFAATRDHQKDPAVLRLLDLLESFDDAGRGE
ncbi:LysR substrate-binding domain-containing protein [Saccharopolyspora sp. NPDC050642]|uniref:LysR family transcriptional regulator n=1 Tax=Saccharopolyspora sp. NPDC050642 TaxID=3157099 RepID=UPI0033EE3B55